MRSPPATARTTSSADWIDYEAAGVDRRGRADDAAIEVLALVDMERAVVGYGLASTADPLLEPELAAKAVAARAQVRERVQCENLAAFVELFDRAYS